MKVLKGISLLVIAALVVLFILQKREIDRLASANNTLSARLADIENQPVVEDPAQAEELARLRKEHGELLKLRGELNVVKRQLQKAKARKETVASATEPADITFENISVVRKYETVAEMTLQQGESAVIGGWETSPGKRTIVLASPTIISATGEVDPNGEQITVAAQFVELPEALFSSHFTPNADGSLKQTFGKADTRRLMQQFKDVEGVSLVAAPNITTLNGRQAQMSVLDVQTIEGKQFEFGPSLDIIPTVTGNGSIHMTMIPSLNLPNKEAGQ